MHFDDITGAIVDASVQIHREIGPGLLESDYEACSRANSSDAACAPSVSP
jgi:hypothetical protein